MKAKSEGQKTDVKILGRAQSFPILSYLKLKLLLETDSNFVSIKNKIKNSREYSLIPHFNLMMISFNCKAYIFPMWMTQNVQMTGGVMCRAWMAKTCQKMSKWKNKKPLYNCNNLNCKITQHCLKFDIFVLEDAAQG